MNNNNINNIIESLFNEKMTEKEQATMKKNLMAFVHEYRPSPYYRFVQRTKKPVALTLCFLFLLFGISKPAAAGALPGEFLYGMKIIHEEIEGATKVDPERKADYSIQRAEKRIYEAKELIADQKLDEPTERKLAEDITKYTTNVQKEIQHLQEKDPEKATALKTELKERLRKGSDELKNSVQEQDSQEREATESEEVSFDEKSATSRNTISEEGVVVSDILEDDEVKTNDPLNDSPDASLQDNDPSREAHSQEQESDNDTSYELNADNEIENSTLQQEVNPINELDISLEQRTLVPRKPSEHLLASIEESLEEVDAETNTNNNEGAQGEPNNEKASDTDTEKDNPEEDDTSKSSQGDQEQNSEDKENDGVVLNKDDTRKQRDEDRTEERESNEQQEDGANEEGEEMSHSINNQDNENTSVLPLSSQDNSVNIIEPSNELSDAVNGDSDGDSADVQNDTGDKESVTNARKSDVVSLEIETTLSRVEAIRQNLTEIKNELTTYQKSDGNREQTSSLEITQLREQASSLIAQEEYDDALEVLTNLLNAREKQLRTFEVDSNEVQ